MHFFQPMVHCLSDMICGWMLSSDIAFILSFYFLGCQKTSFESLPQSPLCQRIKLWLDWQAQRSGSQGMFIVHFSFLCKRLGLKLACKQYQLTHYVAGYIRRNYCTHVSLKWSETELGLYMLRNSEVPRYTSLF